MLWLQIFALVALAGYHRASGKEHKHEHEHEHEHSEVHTKITPYGVYYNSFPYHYITNNKYTSAVVSHKAGPMCSGLHVAQVWVLTAGSCVFRSQPSDLFVITKAVNITLQNTEKYDYLQVFEIFVHSPLSRDGAFNLALMRVEKPYHEVPILKLPALGSSETEKKSQIYLNRFLYHEDKKYFNSHMSPVEAKFNLNECTENYQSMPMNVFYCVNLVEKTPYSYGLLSLGTPLTYIYRGTHYVMGIFTAAEYPVFNNFKKYYLYQSVWPAMEFINSHIQSN